MHASKWLEDYNQIWYGIKANKTELKMTILQIILLTYP